MQKTIQFKLFASLKKFSPPDSDKFSILPDETVEGVLKSLSIPINEVKLVFINGIRREINTVLQNGDRVGIFPPVGGG